MAHSTRNAYFVKYKLYELENLLGGQFMRISKSTILNLDQIYALTKSISNCQIKFHDSYKTVYGSRRYYRDLNERLREKGVIMKKASFGRILWGLGLLAAAAFLVLDQLHMIPLELGFWAIFWTVVFGASLITSLINRSLGGTIFSTAFLLIIYAKPLHIERIVPWTVLLAAFLIWGGLRLIFKKSWKPTVIINGEKVNANWSDLKAPHKFKAEHVFSDTTSSDNGDNIVISEKCLLLHVTFIRNI